MVGIPISNISPKCTAAYTECTGTAGTPISIIIGNHTSDHISQPHITDSPTATSLKLCNSLGQQLVPDQSTSWGFQRSVIVLWLTKGFKQSGQIQIRVKSHLYKYTGTTLQLRERITVLLILLNSGLILGFRPANERCRYKVTTSLIGWAQT